jgi:hypothetical protein
VANINSHWRRFMAVGCTHGHLIDNEARAKVLAFKHDWEPHTTIDLGDLIDTAAFRSGARGTKDECEPIAPDRFAARDWLLEYEPNVITWGNHDWRVWELAEHPNAIVAQAAMCVRDELLSIAGKLKAETRPYNIETGWWRMGDTLVGHGYMYTANAIQEHARKFGRCIFAHLHRTGSESADVLGGPRAWCGGYLGDRTKFTYAHRRPAFFRWNNGLIWGEYTDTSSVIWLAEAPREGEWRLPL